MKELFRTEADLCAAFTTFISTVGGWTVYAETDGWDILLVHHDGTQVGIQAKLRFNVAVLAQAIEEGWACAGAGPDFRAVLVPSGQRSVCDALGLTLIEPIRRWDATVEFSPDFRGRDFRTWHYMNPEKRCELPIYVPDVSAGVSSPVILTRWKIAALRISAVLEVRGYVTRADFQMAAIDHRRWVESWLSPVEGKPGCWAWSEKVPPDFFARQHPEVYPQVKADVIAAGLAEDKRAVLI